MALLRCCGVSRNQIFESVDWFNMGVPERFLAFVNACQIVAKWSSSLVLALLGAVKRGLVGGLEILSGKTLR